MTAVGFGSDPVNTESPAFAGEFALHPPARWAGIIVGAFGAGAVTAALVVAGRVLPAPACALAILAVPGLDRYRPASASGPRNG